MNSIGVDFKLRNTVVNNKRVKLQIWDTAGQERFRTITTSYYKGAQAIVIVFDLTDRETFDHLRNWLLDIEKFAKEGVMRILVGNKCDLESKRSVTEQEGREFAKKYGIDYLETSAKDSLNIEDLFTKLTSNYITMSSKHINQSTTSITGDGILISNNQESNHSNERRCC